MEFSAASIWAIAKMFVRDPSGASRLILAAEIPLNASILMIALSVVGNGMIYGALFVLFENQISAAALANGVQIQTAMPLLAGFEAIITSLVFGYTAFWLGVRLQGKGTLEQVMSVYGVLQVVMCLFGVIVVLAMLLIVGLVPALAAGIIFAIVFMFYVSVRGLGHAIKEAHQLESMLVAAGIIFGALFVTFLVSNFVAILISPFITGAA